MNSIKKITGKLGRERMTIKTFKTSQDMHAFLNKQYDNSWSESTLDLRAGVYAFAGGKWHNVRTLDASMLAHI